MEGVREVPGSHLLAVRLARNDRNKPLTESRHLDGTTSVRLAQGCTSVGAGVAHVRIGRPRPDIDVYRDGWPATFGAVRRVNDMRAYRQLSHVVELVPAVRAIRRRIHTPIVAHPRLPCQNF